MFETILNIVILLFALLGVVDIIQCVILHFLSPKTSEKQIMLLLLHSEDAEMTLRHAIEKTRLVSPRNCDYILAVDCGLTDEMLEICLKISEDSGWVTVCKKEELLPLLDRELTGIFA